MTAATADATAGGVSPAADDPASMGSAAVDLVGPAMAVVRPLADGLTIDRYTELDGGFAINLPEGRHLRLAAPALPPATTPATTPAGNGLAVECDLPPWLTFEAWLPPGWSGCRIELALRAERDVAAELFLRAMAGDAPIGDGPVVHLTLGEDGLAVAAPGPFAGAQAGARQRAILLLRNPPAAFTMDQLRLTPSLASTHAPR